MQPSSQFDPALPQPQPQPQPRRRRRRFGVFRLLLLLLVVLIALFAVPTPWAFHIGGSLTPLMTWDGYGPVQASNGGHYLLFTHLEGGIISEGGNPACDFQGGCETLRGTAKLCTEKGRTYSFDVTGQVHSWWSTDGARTVVDLVNHEGTEAPLPDGWVVALHGKWDGPALVLASPDNSFTEVFTPAGAVRRTTSTADAGTAHTTVSHGSAASFAGACHTLAASAR